LKASSVFVSPTEQQRLIQDSARTLLARSAGLNRLRAVIDSGIGFDAALWDTLAVETGFAGLMVPEAYGGSGLGAVEMALILEETGRTLAVVPFFETAVLAVQTILLGATPSQKQTLLPGIAAGRIKAAVAITGPSGLPFPHGIAVVMNRDGAGWRLNGAAGFVTFAHVADLFLIFARAPETPELSIVALPASSEGVSIERLPSLDLTRPLCRVDLNNVYVPNDAVLGEAQAGSTTLTRALAVGAGLLASEQTGGAQFCLSSTVDYAKQRVQFGRVIGSFQAVKHELADMMVAVEAARSAALYAAAAIDAGSDELFEAASVARVWCSEAYRHCAAEAIQLHGGIGFTWEHHAHLYFKRAHSSSTWLGEPAFHRERVAQLMGLDAEEMS
jgi:alkylation response protein AidB-like acyl-CoA dehydrogenase